MRERTKIQLAEMGFNSTQIQEIRSFRDEFNDVATGLSYKQAALLYRKYGIEEVEQAVFDYRTIFEGKRSLGEEKPKKQDIVDILISDQAQRIVGSIVERLNSDSISIDQQPDEEPPDEPNHWYEGTQQ